MTGLQPPGKGGAPPDDQIEAVERTLADALRPPSLAPQARERLRAAALQAWQDEVVAGGQRSRVIHRWSWAALAASVLLAAAAVVWLLPAATHDSAVLGTIARVNDGGLEARAWIFGHRTLRVGEPLRVGDTLAVRGPTLITLARGGTLRVAGGTSFSVTGPAALSLGRGLVYLDIPPDDSRSNPLRVESRVGVIEHVGTQFEVMSSDQSVRIRIREGQIRLLEPAQTILGNAGTELLLTPGGLTQRAIDTSSRDWLWAAALAPDYQLEGASLIDFLKWVSRESGHKLEFADTRAQAVADRTILHGSVQGQAPMDALSNVLATTSLSYEISGDKLRIHSSP